MVLALFPTTTHAAPETKFSFLMRFYDLNEEAFAYHRHCLSKKGAINSTFLSTLEFVADELFAVSIEYNPKMEPDHIKAKILERRYKIQYGLDRANMNEGCYSKPSLRAKEHYKEFSNYDEVAIRKFIDDNTVH